MALVFPFVIGIILGILIGYFIGYSTAYREVLDHCFAGKSNNEKVNLNAGNKTATVEVIEIGVKE